VKIAAKCGKKIEPRKEGILRVSHYRPILPGHLQRSYLKIPLLGEEGGGLRKSISPSTGQFLKRWKEKVKRSGRRGEGRGKAVGRLPSSQLGGGKNSLSRKRGRRNVALDGREKEALKKRVPDRGRVTMKNYRRETPPAWAA